MTLDDVMRAYIAQFAASLNTLMPGKVITYDHNTQRATVQPTVQYILESGERITNQTISGVPVVFFGGDSSAVTCPVKPGDKVLLLFLQRSIDRWVFGEGVEPIDPKDRRRFNISDCIAIQGLYPFKVATGSHPTNVVIKNSCGVGNAVGQGENAIHVHPASDGDSVVIYGNRNTASLVTLKFKDNGDVELTSPANLTINCTQDVNVTCANADVTASASVVIDAPTIQMNGATGGVMTTESINPLTGLPFPDGSPTVRVGDG